MATNISNTTFSNIYRDDFSDSANYHRILYNGGKALQARELTQSQTIIQKEIERMGTNIFRPGAPVNGGNVTVDNRVEYIKLATAQLPVNRDLLVGKYYKVASPNPQIIVRIKEVVPAEGLDPETIIVEYIDTTAGTATATGSIRVGNGHILQKIIGANNSTLDTSSPSLYPDMTTAAAAATGRGTKAHITKGSFFAQGHFVFCQAQSIFVAKYNSNPSEDIGFQVTEDVVTITDTNSLYENSGAQPNLASPGADRYRIQLTLKTRTATGANNFIYLARVDRGQISDEVTLDTSYNQISNLLALRTKEESGNYFVKRFDLNIRSVDSDNINYRVSDGIAYVEGHRIALDQKIFPIAKPKTTQTNADEVVNAAYGNYVLGYCDTISALTPYDSSGIKNYGLPNIQGFEKVNLYKTINCSPNTSANVIGTARVRHIRRDPSEFHRLYLFDIRMKASTTKSFKDVKSIGRGPTDGKVNLVLEGGQAVLKGTSDNTLLFPLPEVRPAFDGIVASSTTVQKRFTVASGGTGTRSLSVTLPPGTNALTGGSNWIISKVNGPIDDEGATVTGANTFDLTNCENTTYEILADVLISGSTNVNSRAKTLREVTLTKTWPGVADSDGRGLQFISLDKPDIFAIKAIKLADSNGASLSENFTLDNGQRDNYYGIGRIIPKADTTIPNANIFIRFQYFDHEASLAGVGGQKCYFSITSYKDNATAVGSLDGTGVSYDTIPNYTKSNGALINLGDVLDFRPVAVLEHDIDSAGATQKTVGLHWNINFDSADALNPAGAAPLIHLLPEPGGTILSDNTYFLPRKDRIVAATRGNRGERLAQGSITYLQGVPSFSPELPSIPEGSMPLYNINLNPHTKNDKDLSTELYTAKRYTMSDINRLERRIDKIEEITTLTLLELNTSTLSVIDSSGNPRTKAGFLVDNFKDYTFTDLEGGEQRSSIDPMTGHLTPFAVPKANRLIYDSADVGSNTKLKGDLLYLGFADSAVPFLNQDLATTTENINPFAVITSNGHIELSPASDTWMETQWAASDVVSGGTQSVQTAAQFTTQNLGQFANNWVGQPSAWSTGAVIADGRRRDQASSRSVTVRGSVSTVTSVVGDRVLSVSVIPFMRSIKVYFRAQGLRRKTQHFPFFGNTDITNFTRQENFARWATRTDDAGNVYTSNSGHPDGSTSLTTDSTGILTGSFIVPSTDALRFSTGQQIFKLLDVTGGEDSDALSSANAIFTSTGTLETRQQIIQSTRVETFNTLTQQVNNTWWVDPLAQSFWINPIENPNGIFLTRVDCFFATKEDNHGVPVQCQIRPIVAGVPSNAPMPGATKFLNPSQVTAVPTNSSMATVQATPTNFTFDEPVYLAPGQEYAVVLLAESTAYNVYVAQTYEFVLNTTAKRINKQPTLGSLFQSQNGSTWTPQQDKDLMFKIYRADFNTTGSAILNNATPASELLGQNPIQTTAASGTVRVFHNSHGFSKGDQVTISGIDSPGIGGLLAQEINGSKTIIEVDHTGYEFSATDIAGGAATSSVRGGGTGITANQNIVYNTFLPQIQLMELANTSITAEAKLTTGLSYAGSTLRTLGTNPTGSYNKDASYGDIVLNEFNYTANPRVILSDSNGTSASITKSSTIKLNFATTDTKVSPIVDLQRTNFIGFENIIDRTNASNTTNLNKPLVHVAETNPVNGSAAAKHVTKTVTLEESAVGLKILFAANRPSDCEFKVYYRTGTADDDIGSLAWKYQGENTSNPADDVSTTFREYEYLPGGQVGNLDSFTKFQIKIVMNSKNQSKIPTIKDLRIIAMVT